MMMEAKKNPPTAVWHMYVNFGEGGGGKTTIGIFEAADKGLDFIESFGFDGQDIRYVDNQEENNGYGVKSSYYSLEFTSQEAIDKGFLDMYKLYYWERNSSSIMYYMLFLEEVPLNKQLVFVIPEEER